MPTPTPLWQPSRERIESSQMHAFLRRVADRFGIDPDWESLRRWSVEHSESFWSEILELIGYGFPPPPHRVRVGQGMLDSKWFPDLRLNYAEHMLRFSDDRIALHFEGEVGRPRDITYRELTRHVARFADALRRTGVRKGDRVAAFMPNLPETVIAMLATAGLGAIWSSCSPDFGLNGILDRFSQIEPTVLVATDGYFYNGKPFDCLDRVSQIVARLPSLKRVVIVPFTSESPDVSTIPSAQTWDAFISDAPLDVALSFEPLPFDHPLFIMYSSGTTGMPKCIVHGHGGTLLQLMKELMLHCDLRRDDTIFYFTTCGWMMWNWLMSSLGVGATVVLYEGNPAYPRINRLWEMAERLKITVFGTSPKYIAACQKGNIDPGAKYNLSHLRALLSTGSPLSVEQFEWIYKHVKADLQLSSISGGTDIISCFMLGNPILPVHAGEIQCRGLGMDVQAFNESGQPVVGQKGELVCLTPFPSQPVCFWNDPPEPRTSVRADAESPKPPVRADVDSSASCVGPKYKSAYFDHFPGIWRHGDLIEITDTGGVIVYGRSDATLNPGGVRIGTAEIYRVVEAMEEIVDSIVVAKHVEGDEEVCLFVVLREGHTLTSDLTDKIKTQIAAAATKRHVPKHIKQVTAIPHTISGKKVELAVVNMIHNREVKNRDALANPTALDQFRNIV